MFFTWYWQWISALYQTHWHITWYVQLFTPRTTTIDSSNGDSIRSKSVKFCYKVLSDTVNFLIQAFSYNVMSISLIWSLYSNLLYWPASYNGKLAGWFITMWFYFISSKWACTIWVSSSLVQYTYPVFVLIFTGQLQHYNACKIVVWQVYSAVGVRIIYMKCQPCETLCYSNINCDACCVSHVAAYVN